METEFVTVNKVPVRVDSWGGYLPSKITENSSSKPKELILVVPGNPGVTKFYDKFADRLYERTKKPIWVISHGGHDKDQKKLPRLKDNKDLYDLQGQVKQKTELINKYLQGVKLYCVGHSIGSKMILEILRENDENDKVDIEECYFLFPTLERMAETPNGKIVTWVINYILWLTLFGSWIFHFLPRFLQYSLVRIYCYVVSLSPDNIPAIIQLIEPHVLNKVFFLAYDEMKKVNELDDATITANASKLRIYYGATDGWTPLKYYEELKLKHKDVKAEVCSRGYQHAFVLKYSKEVADLVTGWILKT